MKRFSIIPLAVLAITPLHSTTAQEQSPIESGALIRVTAPSMFSDRITGTVVSWESEQLVLDALSGTLTFAIDSITKLEISRGMKSKVKVGAVIGGVVGLLVGAAVFVETQCRSRDQIVCIGNSEVVDGAEEATLLIALGVGVGALIGNRVRTDRWEEVSVSQLRVSFGPQRDGRLGLGLSVKF